MITQEKKDGDRHYGKVWCATCPKTLEKIEGEDYSTEALDQAAIDFLLGVAEHHEHLHPKHKITVTVYERVPTLEEINEEFGK